MNFRRIAYMILSLLLVFVGIVAAMTVFPSIISPRAAAITMLVAWVSCWSAYIGADLACGRARNRVAIDDIADAINPALLSVQRAINNLDDLVAKRLADAGACGHRALSMALSSRDLIEAGGGNTRNIVLAGADDVVESLEELLEVLTGQQWGMPPPALAEAAEPVKH